jgi:hypothetical protein
MSVETGPSAVTRPTKMSSLGYNALVGSKKMFIRYPDQVARALELNKAFRRIPTLKKAIHIDKYAIIAASNSAWEFSLL